MNELPSQYMPPVVRISTTRHPLFETHAAVVDKDTRRLPLEVQKVQNRISMAEAITDRVSPYEFAIQKHADRLAKHAPELKRRMWNTKEQTLTDYSLSPDGEEEYPLVFQYTREKKGFSLTSYHQGLIEGVKQGSEKPFSSGLDINFANGRMSSLSLSWTFDFWDTYLHKDQVPHFNPSIAALPNLSELAKLMRSENFRTPHRNGDWAPSLTYDVSDKEHPRLHYAAISHDVGRINPLGTRFDIEYTFHAGTNAFESPEVPWGAYHYSGIPDAISAQVYKNSLADMLALVPSH